MSGTTMPEPIIGHTVTPEISGDVDRVLSEGNILDYITEKVQRNLVGNKLSIRFIILVGLQKALFNGRGIYLHATGKSSAGKSFLIRQTLWYFPPEMYTDAVMTPQSLFYDGTKSIEPHIYYVDDFNGLNEDLKSTLKNVLTNFRRPTTKISVKKQEVQQLTIPARTVLYFSAVDTIADVQVMNRLVPLPVENEKFMRDIHDYQCKVASGEVEDLDAVVDHDVEVCRQIIRTITKKMFYVIIPYAPNITWTEKEMENTRNFDVFLDLIKLCAICEQNQRETDALGRLIASYDDFVTAANIYAPRRINQVNKLSPGPEKLLLFLQQNNENRYSQKELGTHFQTCQQNISNWLKTLKEMSLVFEESDIITKETGDKDSFTGAPETKQVPVLKYQFVGESIKGSIFDCPLQLNDLERAKPEFKKWLEAKI